MIQPPYVRVPQLCFDSSLPYHVHFYNYLTDFPLGMCASLLCDLNISFIYIDARAEQSAGREKYVSGRGSTESTRTLKVWCFGHRVWTLFFARATNETEGSNLDLEHGVIDTHTQAQQSKCIRETLTSAMTNPY